MTHTYIGPYPNVLGDGRPVAVDESIEDLDTGHPHNAGLLAKGWIVEVARASTTKAKPTEGDT